MLEHYHKGTQSIGRRGRLHLALTAVVMIAILRNVARLLCLQTLLVGDNTGYFRSVFMKDPDTKKEKTYHHDSYCK